MLTVDTRPAVPSANGPRLIDAIWVRIRDDLAPFAESLGVDVKKEELFREENTPENRHVGTISTIELGRYNLRLAPTNMPDTVQNPGFTLVDTETGEVTSLNKSAVVYDQDSITIVLPTSPWSDETVKGFHAKRVGGIVPFEAPKGVLSPDVLRARDAAYEQVISAIRPRGGR
ncbi:MAG: hypothetical protein AAB801_01875 [Patescibacteria group bacterium]